MAVLGDQPAALAWYMTNASFINNTAGGAGGALALGSVTLDGLSKASTFEGNTAGSFGGAVYSAALHLCSGGIVEVGRPGGVRL
jgi:predicted outer membrane repeat protein